MSSGAPPDVEASAADGQDEPRHVRRILRLWVILSVICIAIALLLNPGFCLQM